MSVQPITTAEKRAQIETLLVQFKEHVQSAEAILNSKDGKKWSKNSIFKPSKGTLGTILEPVKDVVTILGLTCEIHPTFQLLATSFKAVVKLETDRKDNQKQVVTLCYAMCRMLVLLVELLDQERMRRPLEPYLGEMIEIVSSCGTLCDQYNKSTRLSRFKDAMDYAEQFQNNLKRIDRMKQDLNLLISQNTAVTSGSILVKVEEISSNLTHLTEFMERKTPREQEAQDIIQAHGGFEELLKPENGEILREVAKKLGDQLDATSYYDLRRSLKQQLEKNNKRFNSKMMLAAKQLNTSIGASQDAILKSLESGPHELVNEEIIRTVWKDMRWRHTVKCRQFVSAIHHHFERLFAEHLQTHRVEHPDRWTLCYLSRVAFYPAIGDAIDEDNSGYLSIYEVNKFFSYRPEDWSVPQWLTYWAAGWYKDNMKYRDKIKARMTSLNERLSQASEHGFEDGRPTLESFLGDTSESIGNIISSIYNNSLDHFEDDDGDAATKLNELRGKYSKIVSKDMKAKLSKLDYALDDQQKLQLVAGPRIEARLMCLMKCLLKHHVEQFESEKPSAPLPPSAIADMFQSWNMVFEAFQKRMYVLVESWRQQRMDVDNQAKHYANGLFKCWWRLAPESSGDSDDEWIDDEGSESEDEGDEEEGETEAGDTEAGSDDENEDEDEDEDMEVDDEGKSDDEEPDEDYNEAMGSENDDEAEPGQLEFLHRSYPRRSRDQKRNKEDAVAAPAVSERLNQLEAKIDSLTRMMEQLLKAQLANTNSTPKARRGRRQDIDDEISGDDASDSMG